MTSEIKLSICGDSWFSADITLPNKSFGEILCHRHKWDLVSLARAGCSNFAIALQIDKAIELNSDFVLIGTTTPDRCEFPIINNSTKSIWEHLKSQFSWSGWNNAQPEVYDKSRGIANILHSRSLSSKNEWIKNPSCISESLNNLIFEHKSVLTNEQEIALKQYVLNLYDSGLKRQIDSWIISDACRRLERANIPYIIFAYPLYERSGEFFGDIEWVGENKIVRSGDFSFFNYEVSDTPFHYALKNSEKIADYIERRIYFK